MVLVGAYFGAFLVATIARIVGLDNPWVPLIALIGLGIGGYLSADGTGELEEWGPNDRRRLTLLFVMFVAVLLLLIGLLLPDPWRTIVPLLVLGAAVLGLHRI